VLERMLFVYAKLNPSLLYVQGMNEILAVIYYCFWGEDTEFFETDVFTCFTIVMAELRDSFDRVTDDEKTGIRGRIRLFGELLLKVDPELHAHIEYCQIDHQFYSLRWLMLLFSQEFSLDDSVRLWDTLFADQRRYNYVFFVCCAKVTLLRETILAGEFSECMEALQSSGRQSLVEVLEEAQRLAREHSKDYVYYLG